MWAFHPNRFGVRGSIPDLSLMLHIALSTKAVQEGARL